MIEYIFYILVYMHVGHVQYEMNIMDIERRWQRNWNMSNREMYKASKYVMISYVLFWPIALPFDLILGLFEPYPYDRDNES
jgi:hypothetical protein